VTGRFAPAESGAGLLRELTPADLDDLQALLQRCSDYFALHDDRPTTPTEARDVWEAVPDGTPREDKLAVGLFAPGLRGFADIVCDWPRRGTWMIGLLVLDPAVRGRGAGTAMVGAIDAAAARAGADTLRIAAIPKNTGGMRFWTRLGFKPASAVGVHPTAIAHERAVVSRP
jgi:GNAT superfamily N-acetyltransferase